ncbi:MAG: helix-turn-helix domain-containing protein [Clostridia bacterium]|nr:helix-turn-helix domain-containing protein [Clostridia bacterium]
MDYSYLDREEYKKYPLVEIEENNNNLPFFIGKVTELNHVKHRHAFVQIIYVSKGSCKHVLNNNAFEIFKGDIFIMPPYVPHYFIQKGDVEIFEFEFIPEFVNEKFSETFQSTSFYDFAYLEPFLVIENMIKPRLNLYGAVQREVEDILREILLEYSDRNENFELMIKALTLKLLITVSREYNSTIDKSDENYLFTKHKDSLIRAIDFINVNYNTNICLDDAVKVSLLSKSYFGFLFKHMTHMTFTEYVNNLRINKAIEFLKERPELKIIDICFEVGYNNVNHFNRIFRNQIGLTPMQVRKNKVL